MPEKTLPDKTQKSEPAKQSLLRRFWEGWKRAGLFIGKVNLYVLTFIVFWTVFAVTSIIAALLRRDFLNIRPVKGVSSHWIPLPETEATIESHQRQF